MAAHPITLDPDLQERLERAAQREVRSPEFILRDAVEMYLHARGETDGDAAIIAEHDAIWDGYDGPTVTREQMLAEAEDSWQHYKRTGLHVTHEEVRDWVGRLKQGKYVPPPTCHT